MIKRIACAALALSLLGSTAAQAESWGHGGGHDGGWHHHGWHGGGAFLGFGLGLLALGAIAHDEDVDRDRYDRDRAYQQDREFAAHGYEPGDRGGPYRGDDNGDGPDRAYRDAPPPHVQDGDRNDAADRDRGDDARGAPHPLHNDDDGDE